MKDEYNGLIIEQFAVGMMEVNCYLVYDAKTMAGIVIDPGDEGTHILNLIEDRELKINLIVLTHGHGDHIGGVDILRRKLGVKLAIGEGDALMLTESALNFSDALGDPIKLAPAEVLLSESDTVKVGNFKLDVIETPGHTSGGISLKGDGFVLSGDLIFAGSIGRVDLPGGDYNTIIKVIKEKILPLGDETVIYPGHGPKTFVAQEKVYNPFLIGG
jgi:hydroxyacylglutathione hydrolase